MSEDNNIQSIPGHSKAKLERTIILKSPAAQKVIERNYKYMNDILYSVSVRLPFQIKNDKAIEKIDSYITDAFKIIEDDLILEQARIKKILDDNGIDELIGFSIPKDYPLEIYTPKANIFIRLVTQLDRLMQYIDTAWMNGEMDDIQKKNGGYTWQRRLMKMSGKIASLEKNARVEASKITDAKSKKLEAVEEVSDSSKKGDPTVIENEEESNDAIKKAS